MAETKTYGPGVMKYVEEAKKLVAERDAQIAQAKNWKFDTISVHGLYSVEEALVRNQGAIIEPLYLSASQAYRDSDELEAALGLSGPDLVLLPGSPTRRRITSNGRWPFSKAIGPASTPPASSPASGMSAIAMAVDPFLVKQKEGEKINFVSCIQVYGGTFQLFNLRKAKERGDRTPMGLQTR